MDPIRYALELHEESSQFEEQGNLPAAEAKCREALSIFEREDGPASPDVANLSVALGSILEKAGRFAEAEACARRALKIVEPLLPEFDGPDGSLIQVHALGLLGTALRQLGQYAAAREPLERAAALAEQLTEHPEELVTALNNFGVLCKFAGWFDDGQKAYDRALAAARLGGAEPDDTVATLYHNIGGLEHARGDYAAAEPPSRRAWEIRRKLHGDDSLETQADAVAYAAVLDGLDRNAEARPIYERALEIYESELGPEHYEVAATLHNLAVVEEADGRGELAAKLYRRALAIKRKTMGADHPDTALTAMNLAHLLFESGKRDEAAELLPGALAAFRKSLVAGHPQLVACEDLAREFAAGG